MLHQPLRGLDSFATRLRRSTKLPQMQALCNMKYIDYLILPIYLSYGLITYLGLNAIGESEVSIVLMIITSIVMLFPCVIFHSISETNLDTDFSDYEGYSLAWHKLAAGVSFVVFCTLPVILIIAVIKWVLT